MNKIIFALKVLGITGLVTLASYGVTSFFGFDKLLVDLGAIVYVISFFTTIYTLIAAFVLVQVWQQSNAYKSLTEREALLLKEMWIYTDYFNDKELAKDMRNALLGYIKSLEDTEYSLLKSGKAIVTPTPQFIQIQQVIDKIIFDDKRDGYAFNSITVAYSNLLETRNQRNDLGVNRLPQTMNFLFKLLEFCVVFSFALLGYHDLVIYFVMMGMISFTVTVTDAIISDIDNPFGGLIVYDNAPFQVAKGFIASELIDMKS
jgi:hypothetical protein